MAILAGIFVLFCAGVIVGQSLLFVRSHEAPKKEPAPQAMIQQKEDPGKAGQTSQEEGKDGKENLPPEQKSENPQK
jgi:hypothetical protein